MSDLKKGADNHATVRFDYYNKSNVKVKNVLARILRVDNNDVAHFAVIRSDNSTAHPGYRPIRISRLRNVRLLTGRIRRIKNTAWNRSINLATNCG